MASERTVIMAITEAPGAGSLGLLQDMILSIPHGLGGEERVKLVAARMLIRPLPDGVEHVSLDSNVFVTEGGVVE